MARGEYTSIGADHVGRGGHGGHGGGHGGRGWGGGGWRGGGWGGWGGWGGGWPYSYGYAAPSYGYGYALPAYDITDGGYVYDTGQLYSPSYGSGWPYASPYYGYGSMDTFPHWRSPRHFMNRHRRRVHHILGQDLA